MTTLGKILVFANLVFSIITGSLILMFYIAGTNWKVGYERERSQHIADNNTANANTATANALLEQSAKDITERDAKLDLTGKQLKTESDNAAKAAADLLKANAEKDQANLTRDAAIATAERLKAEVETLDKRLSEATTKIIDLETTTAEAKKVAVKNSIENKAAQDRNLQLLAQLEQRDKDLVKSRGEQAARAGSSTGRNPPPEDLHGRITQTEGELVTINLGSDSGLDKGNTMEIFRLSPKPTYVGTLRILSVRPNEAVGKLVGGGTHGKPQSGDEVATDILNKR
jgi:transcriptional regulator of heat shock response